MYIGYCMGFAVRWICMILRCHPRLHSFSNMCLVSTEISRQPNSRPFPDAKTGSQRLQVSSEPISLVGHIPYATFSALLSYSPFPFPFHPSTHTTLNPPRMLRGNNDSSHPSHSETHAPSPA